MKKVLIISYYFPPSGGPGVQRVLKFVKYLPEFGWQPVVLTVKNGDFPARDESLMQEIPSDVKVYRTHIFEPYGYYRKLTGKSKSQAIDVDNINKKNKTGLADRLAEFIRATFFIPDARRYWLKHALKEGKKIIDTEKPDLIFSSSPPYTCALIAMKLKKYYERKYGKKINWITDFRDAWTDYLTTPKRWFIPSALDKRYERNVLAGSDAVTMVANGIKHDFDRKYPDISAKTRYELIRNGYDSVDYNSANIERKEKEKFTVVYTGSVYGKRNPFYLLECVSSLVNERIVDKNKIRFEFVGRMGAEISEYIQNSPLSHSIECIPYVTHSASINYLMQADAMLLLIDEDKYSKMILSGKVFEYLGAARITGKPIFAIAGEGEAKDLIEETKAGIVTPHNNPYLLKENFLKLYNGFFENKQTFSPDKNEIAKYERKLLTQRLASLFNELSS